MRDRTRDLRLISPPDDVNTVHDLIETL